MYDQHTHHTDAPPGQALINVPMKMLEGAPFDLAAGNSYSAGLHPMYEGSWSAAYAALQRIARQQQIAAIGECGFDKRSPVPMEEQARWFELQLRLSEELHKPVIVHCVRAWQELLQLHRRVPATVQRIVHGFRGKPELARQLLDAGFVLSFGPKFNVDALRCCPEQRRRMETDDSPVSLEEVARLQREALNGKK
jgi:TatD DNase family protein